MSLWDHTNRLEELFKKYDIPCPQRGDIVWADKFMDLLNTMDALINIDTVKKIEEQSSMIHNLKYKISILEREKQRPIPFGGFET